MLTAETKSFNPTRERLLQVLDAKVVAVLLLSPADEWRCFVVSCSDVCHLELVILAITGWKHIITCLYRSSTLPATALVGPWQEAEDGRLTLTILRWQHSVQVEAKCGEDYERDKKQRVDLQNKFLFADEIYFLGFGFDFGIPLT